MWLLSCYYVKPLLHSQRSLDLKIAEIPRLCYIDTNLISIQNQGSGITSAWTRSWHLSCNTSIHEQRWWNTLCSFSVGESENEKCKSQKTAVLNGTPFENWSYYWLRMTKWVNILIKWQDLIKTWESLLRVSHTERQCVRRASCAHQTLITRHLTDYTFIFLRNHNWRLSQVLVSSFPLARNITHFCLPASPAFQPTFHINQYSSICRKWSWSSWQEWKWRSHLPEKVRWVWSFARFAFACLAVPLKGTPELMNLHSWSRLQFSY